MRGWLLAALLLAACGSGGAQAPKPDALLYPFRDQVEAPESYEVRFETTKGDFTILVTRSWAPNGADRLYNLVRLGYFTDVAFHRVLPGRIAQFGIHGDPKVNGAWMRAFIPADRVTQSNRRGFLTFAQTTLGPQTRTTQLFINLADNTDLDRSFAPVGEVVSGMDVVDRLYGGYGELAPSGNGPAAQRIMYEGNAFLRKGYPELDYIERAALVE